MEQYRSIYFWDARPVNGFVVKIRLNEKPENFKELPTFPKDRNSIKAGDKLYVWDYTCPIGMVYECCFVKGI